MNNIEYGLDEFETGKFPEMDVRVSLDNQIEPNILFYSSMLFITNSLFALYKQYYIYSFLFGLLTTSSLMYHWPSDNVMIGHFDKICILSIVYYGGYMFYNKTKPDDSGRNKGEDEVTDTETVAFGTEAKVSGINDKVDESVKISGVLSRKTLCMGTVVGLFCMVLYFFIYGYFIEDYCFHKQKHMGDIYHALIHLASSIGHHLIMFM